MRSSKAALLLGSLVAMALVGCSGGDSTGGGTTQHPSGAGSVSADAPAASGAAAGPASSGGACIEDGQCVVEKITDGHPAVGPITFSDGVIWAVANNSIVRVDASGTKTFETDVPPGFRVAAFHGFVFWDFRDYLLALDPRGKVHDVRASGCGDDSPKDVTIDAGSLHYLCGNRLYTLDVGAIDLDDVRTSAARNTTLLTTIPGDPHALTIDANGTIYWGNPVDDALEIRTGFTPEVLIGTIPAARKTPVMVATPTHIVLAHYERRSVVAVPKKGGAPFTVSEQGGDTYQMTADASGVYWPCLHGIMRADLDGSNARLLVPFDFTTFVGHVAVSPDAIYWTDPGDDAIYRMKK